jgi:hypothetical protein
MIDRRRALIVAIVCGVLGAPRMLAAQDAKPGKIARIGRLSPLSATADVPNMEVFRKGLRDLGWVEGRTFAVESRFADGKPERLPDHRALAAENRRGVQRTRPDGRQGLGHVRLAQARSVSVSDTGQEDGSSAFSIIALFA